MLDIKFIRENSQLVKDNLRKRGSKASVDDLLRVDEEWRAASQKVDELRAQVNEANPRVATAESKDKKELIEQMRAISDQLNQAIRGAEELAGRRLSLWRSIPNLVLSDVPAGGEPDFELVSESAIRPRPDATKDYLTLLGDDIDLERAAKVSGGRFVYIKGPLARLELALVSYIFDQLSAQEFKPVIPPVLVKEEAMAGMGYLDHDGDEIYQTQDNLYLVGTSEQSIGPMHANEILAEADLPLRYVGFSACFRREAGSHGKDVRGILRLHQFDKVEMFSFTTPDKSEEEHQFLLSQQQAIMNALELPYRVVKLAAQALGAPAAKTYDIETWIPSEGQYRETHSTSNTTDWQARRLKIKVRRGDAVVPAHLLNGTAIALSRILIALIENHQQSDGSIKIPSALHSYLPWQAITPNR